MEIVQSNIQRHKLFVGSCFALLVTSLSFGIRAGNLPQWAVEFNLTATELGTIAATAFWGFPLAVIIGGMVVDIIGMKKLLLFAFLLHPSGILLTVYAGRFEDPYWPLYISTLLIGIANGIVEAACNPLVAALYPDNKTVKLNHFHLWFPGGIVLGTLIVFLYDRYGFGTIGGYKPWQIEVSTMMIPVLIYGILFFKLKFPLTERVAAGISTKQMYRALLNPIFLFMLICMFGTAITELFIGQWINLLLKNVTESAILILTLTTGVMVIGRAFAGPVVRFFTPAGVLLMSAVLSSIGLYVLAHASGNLLFVGALIFGTGVCYFWPTILGFVSDNVPKTGAVGMNLITGAGMFAVSIYTIFMGSYYDKYIAEKLPMGAKITEFISAAPGSQNALVLGKAQLAAGSEILKATLFVPIILVIAFSGLVIYMRFKRRHQRLT
jgi:fucose permease